MKYVHTNLICTDWKQQVNFYCKVFDCLLVPPVRNQKGKWLDQGLGLSNAKLRGAHLRLPGYGVDGPTLELYTYSKIKKQKKVAPNQRGFGHLAFEVKNVKKVLKKLRRFGGEANGEVVSKKVKGVGKLTFVYARDPEGNLIELQNWKK
jgi:catechol 2,3-dioxygenase-like lactoylglutathione lyase family enzyme